ncbi:unnamed protein product [Prorocentrum cordatum]|uniref:C3H1-type domain-containing protein n=1 Tax=Prorocentrum cordatum TaxID=2364126 RepID=A0ABN9TSM0_9DINO|nr:unnamed protein product [Polarella glacialis]
MFFKEGKCTRGDSCKFSHEEGTKDAGRSLPPCQFWAEGRCSRGAACRFSHALGDQREDGGEEAAEAGEPIDLRHDPSVALQTLHEDDDLLAICKPAGVNSHPSSAQESGGTVAHALVGRVPPGMMRQRADQSEKDSLIPRAIMHRLDRGTTGVRLGRSAGGCGKKEGSQVRRGSKSVWTYVGAVTWNVHV